MSQPGLSPLARGTLKPELHYQKGQRFIPAGAGNTMPGSIITSRLSVYPRWRGEHVNGFWRDADWLGLSPLARGTHRHVNINNCHLRFIPAGAGNTCVPQMRKPARTVYPRWRGEHPCMSHQQQYGLGLSPLARGTLQN